MKIQKCDNISGSDNIWAVVGQENISGGKKVAKASGRYFCGRRANLLEMGGGGSLKNTELTWAVILSATFKICSQFSFQYKVGHQRI